MGRIIWNMVPALCNTIKTRVFRSFPPWNCIFWTFWVAEKHAKKSKNERSWQAAQFVSDRPACHSMDNDLMLARVGVATCMFSRWVCVLRSRRRCITWVIYIHKLGQNLLNDTSRWHCDSDSIVNRVLLMFIMHYAQFSTLLQEWCHISFGFHPHVGETPRNTWWKWWMTTPTKGIRCCTQSKWSSSAAENLQDAAPVAIRLALFSSSAFKWLHTFECWSVTCKCMSKPFPIEYSIASRHWKLGTANFGLFV